jgi:hypothetical protein
VLQQFALPLRNLPADTATWNDWSRNLSALSGQTVYISLGFDGSIPGGSTMSTAKVWLEDQYIPKTVHGESAILPQPAHCILDRNHPNPFNPGTVLPFALGREGHVRLSVHDALGREIAVLVDQIRTAGHYQERFDGTELPSGTYVYRLVFDGTILSRSMMLVK